MTNPNQSDGLRDRITWATSQIHDATEWANEPAPDGNGSILDWICRLIPNSDPVETAGEVVTSVDGALTEALRAIEDGDGDAQVIARQTLEQLGIATLEEGR